ncbi:hypothetical protein [Aquimarina aquimarini]|uniref:hypothetical protein n=1 Tax=Aquimarina aquimarini TaxID=1191734 RepID=UPI000D55772B|nr:hypothetical protein [Aquimarina aquimarini]
MLKKLLLILGICLLILGGTLFYIYKTNSFGVQDYYHTINYTFWDSQDSITYDDFFYRIPPQKRDNINYYHGFILLGKYDLKDIYIKAFFDRQQAAIKDTSSFDFASALKKQRLAFDLTEVYARKFNREIDKIRFNPHTRSEHYTRIGDSLYNEYRKLLFKTQNNNQSKNISQELKSLRVHVDKELAKYSSDNTSYTRIINKKNNTMQIVEYYEGSKNKIHKTIHRKSKYDSIVYKHKNGKISLTGKATFNNKKYGIWKFQDQQGNKEKVAEYKIIQGKQYTNQLWYLLPSGDTLNQGTNMKYKIAPRKVKLGDSIRFFFQSDVAEHPNESDFVIVIPKDYTQKNFNTDFSNIKEKFYKPGKDIKKIYSLKYTNKHPKEKTKIDTADHYKTVLFYLTPKRIGKDTIRGYFDEIYSVTKGLPNLWWKYTDKELEAMKIHKDSAKYTETRTIYFDIPIEVYE